MMRPSTFRRSAPLVVTTLAVAGLLSLHLAMPGAPSALAADCGEGPGVVCMETEACFGFWIFEKCTSDVFYRDDDGMGGEEELAPEHDPSAAG